MRFRTSGHRKAHLQSHGHSGNRSRSQKNQQVLTTTEEVQQNETEVTQADNEVLTHQIITVCLALVCQAYEAEQNSCRV